MTEVSVVVPVFNGAATLDELYRRLAATLSGGGTDAEIIFVDDGSADLTWSMIQDLAASDSTVQGVQLARNSGHAAAVAAGFSVACGEIVAMIDVDLETAPEDLPLLVEAVRSGADLAAGCRTAKRRWHRQFGSRVFNAHARRAGFPFEDIGCGMNAMRRQVAAEYVACGHQRRSLVKPLLYSLSRAVVEVPVRSNRPAGSQLRWGDLVTFWLEFDTLVRRPPWFRLAGFGVVVVLGSVALLAVGMLRISSDGPWVALAAVVICLLGVLITALALLAGLLLRGVQSQRMPWFRIVRRIGSEQH